MALEDRCSPQSAPSPPGQPPKSPQHTATATATANVISAAAASAATALAILDMSLQAPLNHQSATEPAPAVVAVSPMTAAAAATLYQQQQQQLQHLHQLQQLQQLHQHQQLVSAANAAAAYHHHHQHHQQHQQQQTQGGGFEAQRLMASPGAHSTSSTPASTVTTIKEEESDSIMGDGSFHACGEHDQTATTAGTATEDEEDDDIDVDDVGEAATPHGAGAGAERIPPPAHQQSAKPTLAFSISNILSDRFGGDAKQQPQPLQQQHPHHHPRHNGLGSRQSAMISANNTSISAHPAVSIFRPFEAAAAARNAATPSAFTRVDLLELSRQQQAAAAAATAAMMIERANFLNCFNPVAYPRIHEEIVQSRLRRNGVMPPAHAGKHAAAACEPNHEKSALGSLCKAVSQIGQHCTPVAAPATASSSASSTPATLSCLASPPPPVSASSTPTPSTATSLAASSCSASSASSSCSSSSSALSMLSSLNSSPPTNASASSSTAHHRMPSKSTSPQPAAAAAQQHPPTAAAVSRDSGMESSDDTRSESGSTTNEGKNEMWPAWVYCTRYSDRPSSGPRYRRPKQPKDKTNDEKRPRTAFSSEQLARLKREFNENRYLTERRRQQLSSELGLNEAQIKIWFQNKRAKIKKSTGSKNPLALQLMAQGLYNHTTVPLTKEEEELEMRMNGQIP